MESEEPVGRNGFRQGADRHLPEPQPRNMISRPIRSDPDVTPEIGG